MGHFDELGSFGFRRRLETGDLGCVQCQKCSKLYDEDLLASYLPGIVRGRERLPITSRNSAGRLKGGWFRLSLPGARNLDGAATLSRSRRKFCAISRLSRTPALGRGSPCLTTPGWMRTTTERPARGAGVWPTSSGRSGPRKARICAVIASRSPRMGRSRSSSALSQAIRRAAKPPGRTASAASPARQTRTGRPGTGCDYPRRARP